MLQSVMWGKEFEFFAISLFLSFWQNILSWQNNSRLNKITQDYCNFILLVITWDKFLKQQYLIIQNYYFRDLLRG